jgi:hypothetical protein
MSDSEIQREKALEIAAILDRSASLGLLCDIDGDNYSDLVFRFSIGRSKVRSVMGVPNAQWWLDGFEHGRKIS